ncbi:hypothetical protein N665_0158s0043 [Sinapis alba]|nr:hypothetical protein N665_0158s0043 [Sinapis alba]
MCKQLFTAKKHELWFEFAGQPLRFSLQEFHAVTGLKCSKEANCDFEKWEDDMGFWSRLLKRRGKISLKSIRLQHLQQCHKWSHVDRFRLIYVTVITSVLMAKDEKIHICHKYIKLVMDIQKLRMYPWGLESYDALVESIITSRKKLKNKTSYVLDGFTYAFQIWIMEAIPDFGKMLGKKIDKEFSGPRCGNWRGAAKISYKHIIQLESLFGSQVTSNYEGVLLDVAFLRDDELTDERVDHMLELIIKHHKWTASMWGFDESVVTFLEEDAGGESSVTGSKRARSKVVDHGAETRKTKLLCKRTAEAQETLNESMKSFLEGLIHSSFTALEEKMDRKITSEFKASQASISALESEVKLLKEAMEKGQSSKGKEPANAKAKDEKANFESLHDVKVSQMPDIELELNTQEYIRKTMDQLSQPSMEDDLDEWLTPSTSLRTVKTASPKPQKVMKKVFKKMEMPSLVDSEKGRVGKDDHEAPLIHYSFEGWDRLEEWSMCPKDLQIGPSVYNHAFANRLIYPKEWLTNAELDACMYLFREQTSLKRWPVTDNVGFMNCSFSSTVSNAYNKLLKEKKKFKLSELLIAYGNGELPWHGRTNKKWDVDVHRVYSPVFVNKNHWISVCINFVLRTVEVFDCAGLKHNKIADAFATIVPRIVKAVQPETSKKDYTISKYSISYAPMQNGLNRSNCSCGVYAIKHIEAHALGIDLSLLDDDAITSARLNIAIDLFTAASDPLLIERISKFEPPKHAPSEVVDLS